MICQTVKKLVKFLMVTFFSFVFQIIYCQVGRQLFCCGTTEELVDGNAVLFGDFTDLIVNRVWQIYSDGSHLVFLTPILLFFVNVLVNVKMLCIRVLSVLIDKLPFSSSQLYHLAALISCKLLKPTASSSFS